MHVDMCMWWIGPMWPKCAFGDQKGLIWKEAMSVDNFWHHGTKKCRLFKCRVSIFIFIYCLWVKRGVLGQKTVLLGVLDQV